MSAQEAPRRRGRPPLVTFRHRLASQASRFALIDGFYVQNGRVPTYREFMRMIGCTSTNAAFEAIQRMICEGSIIKHPTPDGGFILVPAGRRVSNKRGKHGVRSKQLPQAKKRKVKQNQQVTNP